MSKRVFALLVGLLALVLLVAGCGGGGDSSSEALTKAEFIKQGDEICKKAEAQLEDEAEEFAEENEIDTENPSKVEKEEVIETVVAPALHRQAEEIGELGAPSGEEEAVEEILEALETGADELEAEPQKLFSSESPIEEAGTLAQEFGFKECGGE